MRHVVDATKPESVRLAYQWQRQGGWEGLSVNFSGVPEFCAEDSEETFITEHYWGYARQRDGSTVEYQVEHPRWRVWRATSAKLECDVSSLYGPEFVDSLSGTPSTAFVAEGSPIVVRQGRHFLPSDNANAT
jgi:hypothetical protein